MKAVRFGLIAEDASDINVLRILAKKLTTKNFSISYFTGKGCGPIARKTPAWCQNLLVKGCTHVAIVHDLDRNNAVALRAKLVGILNAAPQATKSVVIPTEELEAWLLSDERALKMAFGLDKTPKIIHHPETIASPKEHIGEIVRMISVARKQYVNTVHNSLIANALNVATVRRKCPSFGEFEQFIHAATS